MGGSHLQIGGGASAELQRADYDKGLPERKKINFTSIKKENRECEGKGILQLVGSLRSSK